MKPTPHPSSVLCHLWTVGADSPSAWVLSPLSPHGKSSWPGCVVMVASLQPSWAAARWTVEGNLVQPDSGAGIGSNLGSLTPPKLFILYVFKNSIKI